MPAVEEHSLAAIPALQLYKALANLIIPHQRGTDLWVSSPINDMTYLLKT
jgi:hypothetical protein